MAPKSLSPLPSEILLVYGSLDTGGIETLIVRIANFFVSYGIRVGVCFNFGGELIPLLDSRVNIIKYHETNDLIAAVLKHHRNTPVMTGILVLSFDPNSAARALMVEAVLSTRLPVKHVTGVFHPCAYFMYGERKDRVFLNYLVAMAIGKEHIFFMNEECRESHRERWTIDLTASQILPLPVNYIESKWGAKKSDSCRIVSVGRLVGFKAYNIGAARIVKTCLDNGFKVTWDIYGYGLQSDSIQAEIDLMGVAGCVRLLGKLDYSDFDSTLATYDLFVGMGTAALEAAMIGIPTICATINAATHCYGFLSDLPFGNVGELQSNPPNIEMTDLIMQYTTLSLNEQAVLSRHCRIAAEKYSMPNFSDGLAKMVSGIHIKPSILNKYAIAGLYRFATESYFIKFLRRVAKKEPAAPA